MKPIQNEQNLIWTDLEMTGLNPDKDKILEIAIVPTDSHLNVLDPGFFAPVKYSRAIVDDLDEWCLKVHTESGLIDDCVNAEFNLGELEIQSIEYCLRFVVKGKAVLSGNSIFQDKAFINRYMREFSKVFHYRMIDVSAIKELAKRWYPEKEYPKKKHHRAKDDIFESISELKYYRDHYFKSVHS